MIRLSYADVKPAEDDVLRRLGVPAGSAPGPAVRELFDRAESITAEGVDARGIVRRIARDDFARVYEGEGRNAPASPLAEIYSRADALALFLVTIGSRLEEEIAALFRDDDPALGCILDAYASSAVNRAVDALTGRFASEVGGDGVRVLAYSPGYCGWHLTGQRALFAALRGDGAGVTLGDSCLMTPLKSVSGVLVAGDAAVHRFRPDYPFCEECDSHDCIPRMASVRQ
ncbi:MAG: hypothetical protein LC732_06345 [Acidobacteria bacterium]|nr:hypothetical protein [Acidobacteriota bacterium]